MSRISSYKPKRRQHKDRRPHQERRSRPHSESSEDRGSRVHRDAAKLLRHIGKPEPTPFVPDPFQIEAVAAVMDRDVLVSAPTGSGKTWIAMEATDRFLKKGARIWYATPLKALSNAKFSEFGAALGPERVGILTGDRKENPDAEVVVGTTEILRNQLYDSMQMGVDQNIDLVILDEAHYLGDRDRGVVWEEVLIYLPNRVRLLLLSATIANAEQVAGWLQHIRGEPCAVVRSDERPVPLHVLYRFPDGQLTPLARGNKLFPGIASSEKQDRRGRRLSRSVRVDINGIVATLREHQLLPAIVFLKSRADCDRALNDLYPSPQYPDDGGFDKALKRELDENPDLANQRGLEMMIERRAGSHHAGQLPAWRILIERMMSLGHLEVIFSTSTVAAGVNFPARTVVIPQSDRFDGHTFVDLTATEFHQMTGRAGRRGMDKVGYTLIVPSRYMKADVIKHLLGSEPEPLESRIGINFSMTLNLLLSYDPAGVRQLLGLSFAAYHENPKRARKAHRKLQKDFQDHLDMLVDLYYVDENGNPTYDGKWAAQLRLDHPLLIAELIREGAFQDLLPEELAALIAPFVMDKEKEIGLTRELWNASRPLWKKWRAMMKRLKPLAGFMIARGFEAPPITFWPAAAVHMWAGESDWSLLTEHVTADEGDLAMLILRTADHLRQLVALQDDKPELAAVAKSAVPLLMRPPVI